VTKYGRESVVLLSVDTYKSLLTHYREAIDTNELDDLIAGATESTDIPEQHRWHAEDEKVSDEQRGAGR
jgi:hypothetical protein